MARLYRGRELTGRQSEIVVTVQQAAKRNGGSASNGEVWEAMRREDFRSLHAEMLVLEIRGAIAWDDSVARWSVPNPSP